MSDIRSDLELAFIAMLRGDAGLAGVQTFEASVRECLFSGDKLTLGFRAAELPAVAVSAQLKPMTDGMFTPGERGIKIPMSVTVVTRSQRKSDAIAAAAAIQDAINRVIGQARRSGNALGDNTYAIDDVSASATTVEEKPLSFAISTAEFTVLKVVDL